MNKLNTNPAHILLVEDNEGDIFLTLEAFEEYRVKTEISIVKNGQEALDFLFQRETYINAPRPDLILLDINIPIFNGHEVLSQIKTDTNLKNIPVFILSTSSNQKDWDEAYGNHCENYLKKPIDLRTFLDALQSIEKFWLDLRVTQPLV